MHHIFLRLLLLHHTLTTASHISVYWSPDRVTHLILFYSFWSSPDPDEIRTCNCYKDGSPTSSLASQSPARPARISATLFPWRHSHYQPVHGFREGYSCDSFASWISHKCWYVYFLWDGRVTIGRRHVKHQLLQNTAELVADYPMQHFSHL